jgi:predicted nucleic acid-binding protein
MTKYLLDTNVVSQSSKRNGNKHVLRWLDEVDDAHLAISAITVRELWYGVAQARANNHPNIDGITSGVSLILDAFVGRILHIDEAVAKLWAELLAAQNKHVNDKCLVAVARVNGLTLVTQNVKDTAGLGAEVLDPFTDPAKAYPASG